MASHIYEVEWNYNKENGTLTVSCGTDSHYKGVEMFLQRFGSHIGKPYERPRDGKLAASEMDSAMAVPAPEGGKPTLNLGEIRFNEKDHSIVISGEHNIKVLVNRAAKSHPRLFGRFLAEDIPWAQRIQSYRNRQSLQEAQSMNAPGQEQGIGKHLSSALDGNLERRRASRAPEDEAPPHEQLALLEIAPGPYGGNEPMSRSEAGRMAAIRKSQREEKKGGHEL